MAARDDGEAWGNDDERTQYDVDQMLRQDRVRPNTHLHYHRRFGVAAATAPEPPTTEEYRRRRPVGMRRRTPRDEVMLLLDRMENARQTNELLPKNLVIAADVLARLGEMFGNADDVLVKQCTTLVMMATARSRLVLTQDDYDMNFYTTLDQVSNACANLRWRVCDAREYADLLRLRRSHLGMR